MTYYAEYWVDIGIHVTRAIRCENEKDARSLARRLAWAATSLTGTEWEFKDIHPKPPIGFFYDEDEVKGLERIARRLRSQPK